MRNIKDLKPTEQIAVLTDKEAKKIKNLVGMGWSSTKVPFYFTQTGDHKLISPFCGGHLTTVPASDFLPKRKSLRKQVKELRKEVRHLKCNACNVVGAEEVKNRLEIGKWYKSFNGILICIVNEDGSGYGFIEDRWKDCGEIHATFNENWKPATPEEVETALINEVKERGFKVGSKIKSLFESMVCVLDKNNHDFKYREENNDLISGCNSVFYAVIFKDGKWATIIEQPTEIDWSNPGQLVCKHGYVFLTSGEFDHSLSRFTGTCLKTEDAEDCPIGSVCDDLPQNLYVLFKEPITLCNE